MSVHETRSDIDACPPEARPVATTVPGVGARQQDLFASEGGGGYLNERIVLKNFEKAKLQELATMGLPAVWLRVANAIGYENFLQFWKIIDSAAEAREVRRSENESMIEIQLRRYSSFTRFQRNRFIETLGMSGYAPAAIQELVAQQLGEKLDRSHIRKLSKRGRIGR